MYSIGKVVEKRYSHTLLMGMWTWGNTYEKEFGTIQNSTYSFALKPSKP